jgi:hypothetical protein
MDMQLTLVVRRPFACESAWDKLPRPAWGLPAVARLCWAISAWWTACLAVMTGASVVSQEEGAGGAECLQCLGCG